jgi:glycosyltransferase involved in cell wall biosynthesis
MCVYRGDQPKFLVEAVESILNQTVKSNDIVIVVDGPIGKKLQEMIEKYAKLPEVTVKWLPKNVGVGPASNAGIATSRNELIAKLDADDIAVPERIEKQLKEFNADTKLTLLGGQMKEFCNHPDNIVGERKVPTEPEAINHFARKRDPFNNSTVMYKKSAVVTIGGYPDTNRSEDYLLVAKLLAAGERLRNLPDNLAYYHLNDDTYRRRKTWKHTKATIAVRWQIHRMGVAKLHDFLLVATTQFAMFLLPSGFTKLVYKIIQK